jgi:uncharacterized protein YndB with AHSA1/START domain
MVDILHKVGIKSPSVDRVYQALTTLDGLAGWWTRKTTGQTEAGGVIEFRFEKGGADMKVVELQPGKSVLWEVVGGANEWLGTRIGFELRQDGDYVTVLFGHRGWKASSEFMHHCSTKWASFLFSLKALVETGRGAPFPDDVHVFSDAM